ncbi:hypothetical protein [Erythrobacter sp. EC-HK427]|uniref:hypothetical protein n=1 Tax=Erythrobacter sp. EC-HK427 TaxID=2038396 RepID=UPI001257721B|nr:hypothetical protein [Erythrobacter sp. EC-HK427]VVT05528.1 hypothetical protein ERY430_41239 [Erythrobacter sp. EC-HK427]
MFTLTFIGLDNSSRINTYASIERFAVRPSPTFGNGGEVALCTHHAWGTYEKDILRSFGVSAFDDHAGCSRCQ